MIRGGEVLKEVFKGDTFTEQDISKALKLSNSKAHTVRLQLTSNNEIMRVARGVYTFAQPTFMPLPPPVEFLRHTLDDLGLPYAFTSSTLFLDFFNDQTYEIISIYVGKGTGSVFEKKIEKSGTQYVALVEPDLRDFDLLLRKARMHDFVAVRENAYFYAAKNGLASIEKAFVDLYFELTRKRLPLPDRATEILESLIQKNCINYTTLLKCAHERGLKKELLEMLRAHTKRYGLGDGLVRKIPEKIPDEILGGTTP